MGNNQKNESEFFEDLTQKVLKIPILQVIGSLEQVYRVGGYPVPPEQLSSISGGSYQAYCPFHADKKLGSFVITPEKNMWWCFTEGIGWNGIHYEQRKFGLSFEDAVFHLAKRFGLITEQEELLYGKKIDADVVNQVRATIKKPEITRPGKKAPQRYMNIVYRAMAKKCRLKPAHRDHLIRERLLSENDLEGFFTFPDRNTDIAKIAVAAYARILAEEKYKTHWSDLTRKVKTDILKSPEMKDFIDELPNIPGLFKRNNRLEFSAQPGIGILVEDDLEDVLGIQDRRDYGDPRYVWFSSGFAAYKDGFTGGSSPGAPGGVVFPKKEDWKEKPAKLCITEGRFKAEALARAGMIAIYVSGVSSWKNIREMYERLKKKYGIQKTYVIFDSDMMGNTAVHGQLKALCEYIESKGSEAILLLWRIRYGKGFDDLVFKTGESYKKHLIPIRFQKFEKGYRTVIRSSLKSVGVNTAAADRGYIEYENLVKDIPEEKRRLFNRMMQNRLENGLEKAKEKKRCQTTAF